MINSTDSGRARVALCCAAHGKPKYLAQIIRWAQTFAWHSERNDQCSLFVGICDGPLDSVYLREFSRLDVNVVETPVVSDWHGPSNKLGILCDSRLDEYEYVILTDCDIAFAADPIAPLCALERIRAKPADAATLGNQDLLALFQAADLPVPTQRLTTTIDHEPLIPYCNSGVVVLPRKIRKSFVQRWLYWNEFVLRHRHLLGENTFFSDQASFAMALSEFFEDFSELSVEYNFPTHFPLARYPQELHECDPSILHYHDKIDGRTGKLQRTGLAGADRAIAKINERISIERRVYFSNTQFWDTRYLLEPELGSGIGSRGEFVTYKAERVRNLISAQAYDAVVDLGCGDCSILQQVEIPGYIGVDASRVVVAKNRQMFPQYVFRVSNLLDYSRTVDLSLCFDVVIHQPTLEMFEMLIDRILGVARLGGLVNGFDSYPGLSSDIVFYHRPLIEALEDRGVECELVGAYRDTNIYSWRWAEGNGPESLELSKGARDERL